ncbi:Protein BYN-1 [Aphelenchoides avenae]|nr:Protein BYN-1 [Aphelenchus avenae]
MGRKRKIKSGAGDLVTAPGALDAQIEKANIAKSKEATRVKLRAQRRSGEQDEFVQDDLSAKILDVARKQREAEEREEGSSQPKVQRARNISLGKLSIASGTDSEDDEEALQAKALEDEVVQLDPKDEEAVNKFLAQDKPKAQTLFDIIQEKIEQKKVDFETQFTAQGDDLQVRHACAEGLHNELVQVRDLNPEVVEMYTQVGEIMSRYRTGKIPKAFKIIPSMVNWEQILELTVPEKWTAAAMLHATRLFSSNLNAKMCQRFYNLVLLPRVRDDIDEFKKLNFHLYQCLFRAMYKPAAFFKGILLPLCDGGCTLREATIIASVLRKCSIPVLHAAAAMVKIAEMDYGGASSLFLRVLIEKKYTLPFRALDALVFHFLRMQSEKRELPVLWHQALLALVQHYKHDISSEQREALLELLKVQNHYQISPEIRRELQHAESRNEESEKNIPEYVLNDGMEF